MGIGMTSDAASTKHLLIEPPNSWLETFCKGELDQQTDGSEADEGLLVFLTCRASTRSRVSAAGAARSVGLGFLEIPWDSFYGNEAVHRCALLNVASEVESMKSMGVRAIIVRPISHDWLVTLAKGSSIPIVNACSDKWHPLQAVADLRALYERFSGVHGLSVAFIGNGRHPTVASLSLLGTQMGMRVIVAGPADFAPPSELLNLVRPGTVRHTTSIDEALSECDAVYLDEWVYQQPSEEEERMFARFRLTADALARHRVPPVVLHCLPHADEVDSSLLFGPTSLVWRQAALRRAGLVAVLRTLLSETAAKDGWH